jgi:putative transposase
MKKSKFTEEQIVRILQEAAEGKKTHTELCKEHGVNLNTFYIWRRKYAGLETQDVKRMKELERENDELKKLVAERELEISAVRKLFRKNGWSLPSELRERSY